MAYEAPRATAYAAENGRGWTPVPTSKPRIPAELLKRGLLAQRQQTEEEDLFASTILVAEDQTCGYLSGAAGKSKSFRVSCFVFAFGGNQHRIEALET